MVDAVKDAMRWADRTAVRRQGRRSSRDERRAELVVAAIATIEDLGPTAGTSQIAERAGVPRPHVYRHFESKDELDAEIVRTAAADLIESVRPTLATGEPLPQMVHDAVAAAVGWAADHPNLYRFLAARQQTRALHRTRLGRGRFMNLFVEAAAAYAAEESQAVSDGVLAGLMGMVDASIIWWLDHSDEEQDAVVQRLTRQLLAVVGDLLAQLGLPDPDTIVLPS